MEKHTNWYIYKITYPNGKIYIGQVYKTKADRDTVVPWLYIGSSKNPDLISDCKEWMMKKEVGCLKQEILFQSTTCTRKELKTQEREWIKKLGATDPKTGYNQRT